MSYGHSFASRLFVRCVSLAAMGLTAAGSLPATRTEAAPLTLYTSNNLPTQALDVATDTNWLATQFNTYGYAATIDSLVMNFPTAPSDLSSTALHLDLYSSASGVPGVQLARFTNPGAGTGNLYTFTLGSSPTLSASSSYWIVLSMTGTNTASWNATFSTPTGNSNPSNPAQFDPQSANWVNGTFSGQISWGTPDTGPYQMDVYVNAVPEPSTWAMLIAAGSFGALSCVRRRLHRRASRREPNQELASV